MTERDLKDVHAVVDQGGPEPESRGTSRNPSVGRIPARGDPTRDGEPELRFCGISVASR